MYGQVFPGKPGRQEDTWEDRLSYFESCLDQLAEYAPSSVAMPYMIGCGLAGGDWDNYLELIGKFDDIVPVTLYKLT